MPTYDYIIIGAGASGLLLADALGRDDFFASKSILLLERDRKQKNDRTWCFWEEGNGAFDGILFKTWPKIHFTGQEVTIGKNIAPYCYKMLRGLDFYSCYLEQIRAHTNIFFAQDEVLTIEEKGNSMEVHGKTGTYFGKNIFDSRFEYQTLLRQKKYPVLQQHFLGWFIKTPKSVFNVDSATFMDFSVQQKGNTRFMYVLPFSENEALVEYTLFSEHVLEKLEYENAIKDYIKDLGVDNYEITEVERGNIPMTCFDFTKDNTDSYLKIGIAGGWAKASTGFTFYNSSKKVAQLVAYLKSGRPLSKFQEKNRYWFYDLLFLDVLYKQNHLGSQVFESLFRKKGPKLVLKFLDEETSLWQDLEVMWACPKLPFIRALLRRLLI